MSTITYEEAEVDVRDDLRDAHQRAWDDLGRPGSWWTGAERVAIAREVRQAAQCALCRERGQALSPYTVAGDHDHLGDLPDAAVEVIHRVTTDPGRLKRDWFDEIVPSQLSDAAYVELIGLISTLAGIDSFCRGLGVGPHPLPEPVAGEPSRSRPEAACDEGAWVATIPANRAVGNESDLYKGMMGQAPNVMRALSLVPDAVRTLKRQGAAHYLEPKQMMDLTAGRSINRAQIELVASRTAAKRGCFY